MIYKGMLTGGLELELATGSNCPVTEDVAVFKHPKNFRHNSVDDYL